MSMMQWMPSGANLACNKDHMKSESFVSLVLLACNGMSGLKASLVEGQALLEATYSDYEIVVVGMGPASASFAEDDQILNLVPCVRFIQLTSAVHEDVAWGAGLETAIGDFVVLLNPATDPISVIPALVDSCRAGYDVVIGTAEPGDSLGYVLFRAFADRVLRAIEYDLPRNATGLRCLSRRAVNSVTRVGRFHHQFYLRIQKTGYPSLAFPYALLSRRSRRDLAGGCRNLIRLMVFNSSRPLRWMSLLGFSGSVAACLFATYSVLLHLVTGNVVQGWTTTVLFMSFLFMLQFIMMAFFGEYLGRLLDDRSEQADYAVIYEKNSSIMVNADRVNVMLDSVPSAVNKVQTGRDR